MPCDVGNADSVHNDERNGVRCLVFAVCSVCCLLLLLVVCVCILGGFDFEEIFFGKTFSHKKYRSLEMWDRTVMIDFVTKCVQS